MAPSVKQRASIPLVCLLIAGMCGAQVAPELPPSAKQRFAAELDAKDIRGIDELVFRRAGEFEYLGVQAGFAVPWWWESVFRHGYVLRKRSSDPDWSKAELFDVRLPVGQVLSGPGVLESELLPWKRPNQSLQPTADRSEE